MSDSRVGMNILSSIVDTVGALIIRIGSWGPFDYYYNKEPPKLVLVIISGPYITCLEG